MDAIRTALADPIVHALYLAFCVALMVLPAIAVARWYHAQIRGTPGGRDLMQEQARIGVRRIGSLPGAARMARDIAAGRYGADASAMQGRLYRLVGLWLFAVAIAVGILIWADAANRAAS